MLYAAKCYWPGVTQADLDQVGIPPSGSWTRPGSARPDRNTMSVLALFELSGSELN